MLRRRFKLLGKILLGFIVLVTAFLLIERWRGQIALANYKKELRAKGEKLSPQDFVKPFKAEDNGAPVVYAAVEKLTNGIVLPYSYPPRMKLLESGRAVVGFREPEWVEKDPFRDGDTIKGLVTFHWAYLAADLQTNAAALAEIQAALRQSVLNNQLDFAAGTKMKFGRLAPVKQLTHWFGGATQLALHEGRNADALQYLVSQIHLPRLLAEDGIVISELVRIAIATIARTDTWEALQAEGWTDADLAAMQQAWAEQNFARNMSRSLEGERVYMAQCSQQLRASNEDTYEMMFGEYSVWFSGSDSQNSGWWKWLEEHPYNEEIMGALRKQIFCRLWRFSWSHQSELRTWQTMQELTDIMRAATTNASNQSSEAAVSEFYAKVGDMNFYDQIRFPSFDGVGGLSRTVNKAMQAETHRSLCLTAIALKRYSLRHGKLPENLNALVPEFLSTVLVDYMDGQPIKYRLNADGSFTLYSVGEDGKDDGGDMTLLQGTKSRDLWKRRDYVWPAPATPEEIEEYRKKAVEN